MQQRVIFNAALSSCGGVRQGKEYKNGPLPVHLAMNRCSEAASVHLHLYLPAPLV